MPPALAGLPPALAALPSASPEHPLVRPGAAQAIKPPWVPSLADELDTSHFEEYSEEEKPWNNVNLDSIPLAENQHIFSEF